MKTESKRILLNNEKKRRLKRAARSQGDENVFYAYSEIVPNSVTVVGFSFMFIPL